MILTTFTTYIGSNTKYKSAIHFVREVNSALFLLAIGEKISYYTVSHLTLVGLVGPQKSLNYECFISVF